MEKKLEKKPYLLLYTDKGKRYLSLASKNYWTIGRGKENGVVIRDQCISRNHAILQSTDSGEFYLIDLGSRNGTFVNGRRVSIPVTLSSGDRIAFGKTKAEFYSPQTDSNEINEDEDDLDTMTSTIHQRQLISVVVTDIRDFTVLAQQLDEKVLSALIGNWFRQAGSIIRNAGSWVDKYIGDAVMAIWFHGQDQVTKDDLLEIFRAVKNLHDMTQNLSKQYTLPFPLRIGAGINTGHAMVGNTGSGDHPDYTAIGDTVNAAFRLESSTKQIGLDVALGGKTFECLSQLDKAQTFFQEYTVTLKGYQNPTLTYGANFSDLGRFLEINDDKTSEL
ncbi:MAG: FHA domain-containing protein [Microcystaceae cyanobacterium]